MEHQGIGLREDPQTPHAIHGSAHVSVTLVAAPSPICLPVVFIGIKIIAGDRLVVGTEEHSRDTVMSKTDGTALPILKVYSTVGETSKDQTPD